VKAGGSRNVGSFSRDYTALYPRRQNSTYNYVIIKQAGIQRLEIKIVSTFQKKLYEA
jgi:hypothetical protein